MPPMHQIAVGAEVSLHKKSVGNEEELADLFACREHPKMHDVTSAQGRRGW